MNSAIIAGLMGLAVAVGSLAYGIPQYLKERDREQAKQDEAAAEKRHELAKLDLVLRSVATQRRPIEETREQLKALIATVERLKGEVGTLQPKPPAALLTAVTQSIEEIKTHSTAALTTLQGLP